MLTDKQLEIISEALAPLFEYLEQAVITDIARRINKTMEYTRTAELQAMSMKSLGYSPMKIRTEAMKILRADAEYIKEVERNTIGSKREIKKIIDDIVKKAQDECDELIGNAGEMSWIDDMRVWQSQGIELTPNNRLVSLVEAIQRQTNTNILNLSQSLGFKLMRGYESIETLYRGELNRALIKVFSGTFSADTVVRDVIHNLAQSGLRSIDYGNGYSTHLDTAVKRAIRTGSHQLSGQVSSMNIVDTHEPLCYVDEHANARNKGDGIENHEKWQGKVYSVRNGDYTEEAKRIGQDEITDLYEATGYSIDGSKENNPLGLYGYNCRHNVRAWFIGASSLPERLKQRPSVEYKGKTLDGYAQTQELRRQEANIRKLKREREALSTLKQPTVEITKKIDEAVGKYKGTCESFGVKYTSHNLRYEPGTSDITKTDAYTRYLKEIEKMGEM